MDSTSSLLGIALKLLGMNPTIGITMCPNIDIRGSRRHTILTSCGGNPISSAVSRKHVFCSSWSVSSFDPPGNAVCPGAVRNL